MIGECLVACGSRSLTMKLQNYEMEKYVKLNEDVLDDETNLNLIEIAKNIMIQLDKTVAEFERAAKAKGLKYNIEQLKKEYKMQKQSSLKDGKKKYQSNKSTIQKSSSMSRQNLSQTHHSHDSNTSAHY